MVTVEFLAIFGIILGPLPILGKIGVGPEQGRTPGPGKLNQHIVAHAIPTAHPDIFSIYIDSGLQHSLTQSRYCNSVLTIDFLVF
jgi:hypothetical protein